MALGIRGRTVDLFVQFRDFAGNPVNTDETPKVSVSDLNGRIWQASSSSGVSLVQDPSVYKFSYLIPPTFPDGYASATFSALVGNDSVTNTFYFQVISSGSVQETTEPSFTPGDSIDFEFTEEEVIGINTLLKILKIRLKNDGTRKVPNGAGGFIDVPCAVFANSELIAFLVNSLSEFNQIPHFTSFTFADSIIYGRFADVIIQGAVILALAAQSLIEKGREFIITDNGISFQPPAVSDILNNQYNTQLTDYKEKVKFIKCNLKPAPLGLGTFRTTAVSPAFLRLRHLKERQIL